MSRTFTEDHAKGLLLLAGFEVQRLYQLENKYWPSAPEYADARTSSPWWLVKTQHGLIELGWRKRVLQAVWEDTAFRGIITEDDVTKDETLVHAYTYAKAVEYLTTLATKLRG